MNDTVATEPSVLNAIANTTIADLVETTPDVMSVLAPLGLDLCCGGGRPLGEALALHGIDADPVIRQIASLARPIVEP